MTASRKFAQAVLSLTMILSMVLSLTQTQPVAAQGGDGVNRQFNSETGKVSFLGPLEGKASVPARSLGIRSAQLSSPTAAAMALAKRFAPEFGVQDPERNLTVMKTSQQENGRVMVRYQQKYQGIPVIAGELIVNTNENGDLYSMNGEVAQELSLDTQPAIAAEVAIDTAKQGMVKWYGGEAADYQQTQPALWIFDEKLLNPSTRPAELVWRLEMTSLQGQPVRELVLVNARTGDISLHFNQVRAAWEGDTQVEDPVSAEALPPAKPTRSTGPSERSEDLSHALPRGSVEADFTGTTRYVASAGTDYGSCTNSGSPCARIQYAINQAVNGDIIKVAIGTYYYTTINSNPNVVILNKGVLLSGGWQSGFASQTGASIIDGQNTNNGILVTATSETAVDRFIIQSSTSSDSGAIYHLGANLTLTNSTLKNNSSGRGAGIFVTNNAILTVINSTISNNTAANNGGGIFVNSGTTDIEYSTIAYNTATNGGGGIYRNSGTLNIYNSVLAKNNNSASPNCNSLTASDYNVIDSITGCTFTKGTHDQTDVSGPVINSSLLGTMQVHPLMPGSPAIDAADTSACTTTDQNGLARPQRGGCDIGASEYPVSSGDPVSLVKLQGDNQYGAPGTAFPYPLEFYAADSGGVAIWPDYSATFTAPLSGPSGTFAPENETSVGVTSTHGAIISPAFSANTELGTYTVSAALDTFLLSTSFTLTNVIWYVVPGSTVPDPTCDSPASPCATIGAALTKAQAGTTIYVSAGTITSTTSPVVTLTKNITISGGWNTGFTAQDSQTIIDGENLRRGVAINSGITAVMDRFDVKRGKVQNADGAGILNSGALTFTNGAIYNNTAHHVAYTDPTSDGGGIASNGTQLTLTNVTLSNNEADTGGGLFIQSGNATLNNVTITQNFATNMGFDAYGGGLENKNNYNSLVTLTNSIIAGNAAEIGQDCSNTIISGGNNLIGFNVDCNITPTTGDQIGTQLEPIDAKLGDLGDNSSSTKTHALLTGSPAIDAGNPATCAATDQRGVARPQGAACDIGAFEGSETQSITANIKTYTAGNAQKWPGSFLCDFSTPDCTGGSDTTADKIHQTTILAYNFYLSEHGRKSMDNNNMPIVSTVHYCTQKDGCPFRNAFWTGAQMLYGDGYGFANADDIIMHEITHGITQYESNLMYWYQAGAIDESLADVWAEYFDQTNTLGTDGATKRWKIGEDLTGLGVIRSMKDPPAYNQPDMMTSSLYDTSRYDYGGIYTNSGVNNKAVYLMVDGGAFNGQTVTGIGWKKTITIYYEAQTNLLTSGSDYSDLYYALQQACINVTGQYGINETDCKQVKKALNAVQMNSQPAANFNPDASVCPTGKVTDPSLTLFKDGFENGMDNWNSSGQWALWDFFASEGSQMMFASESTPSSDNILEMKTGVTMPSSGSTYLFFKHSFAFSWDSYGYYHGAILQYSKNGGNWQDAKSLFSAGQNYNGTILQFPPGYEEYGSALQGRSGFVGNSHGYVSSRYDLKSLAGQTVRFRWRYATDWDYYDWGWAVDDVRIYQCVGTPSISAVTAPLDNALLTNYTPLLLDWADSTPSLDRYHLQVATDNAFNNLVYNEENLPTSQFQIETGLDPNTPYYWHVQAFNVLDLTNGWSSTWIFRTALTPPTLGSPTEGEQLLTRRPELDWSDVTDATGYKLVVSRYPDFSTPLLNVTTTASSFNDTDWTADLPANKLIYWRVKATGANPSAWTSGTFTSGQPPSIPVLVAPVDGAMLKNDYTPLLDWNDSAVPTGKVFDHYHLQVASNPDFSAIVLDQNILGGPTASSFTPSSELPANDTYYWRVQAYSTDGHFSSWSPVWSFTLALEPPDIIAPLDEAVGVLRRPTLDWSDVTGATGYKLVVSRYPDFSTPLLSVNVTESIFNDIDWSADLPANKVIYWRVKALGDNPSAWTSGSFTTVP